MQLTHDILNYIEAHRQEAFSLLQTLAQIPAPSNQEQQRAAFCSKWLTDNGAEGVYVDEVNNVVYPIGCDGDKPIAVFMAHSDVVFPDTQPLPLTIEDDWICCPGIGDDTGNVVALMTAAKYIAQAGLQSKDWGILIVINAGEEGLGNLAGCRKIFAEYGTRIKEFVTFDLGSDKLHDRAVGSRRFEITVRTQGGHSLSNFGRPNAIACLAGIISDLYQVTVPTKGRTTYNVGVIHGGTSVNTIAQNASMLYEFRSDDRDCLEVMQGKLDSILQAHQREGVELDCRLVGDRPCSAQVDAVAQGELSQRAEQAALAHFGELPERLAASTDCNIPLSLGIPSVCIGCLLGEGAHTRQERVQISSLLPGLKLCLEMVLYRF